MSWTKKQLIEHAFNELGLSSYTYDMVPDQYAIALSKLDAMLAMWTSTGMNLMYNLSDITSADISQNSGLPDWANEAVYLNLALKLAPSYGKIVSNEGKTNARVAYSMFLNKVVTIPQMQYDNFTPLGAGNKNRYNNTIFIPEPIDNLQISNSTNLE